MRVFESMAAFVLKLLFAITTILSHLKSINTKTSIQLILQRRHFASTKYIQHQNSHQFLRRMSAIKKGIDSIIHPESTQDKGKSMGDDGSGGSGAGTGLGGLTGGSSNAYQSDTPKAQGNLGGAYGDQPDSSLGQNMSRSHQDEKDAVEGSQAKQYGMGATQ
jgi:hypothetical protein